MSSTTPSILCSRVRSVQVVDVAVAVAIAVAAAFAVVVAVAIIVQYRGIDSIEFVLVSWILRSSLY